MLDIPELSWPLMSSFPILSCFQFSFISNIVTLFYCGSTHHFHLISYFSPIHYDIIIWEIDLELVAYVVLRSLLVGCFVLGKWHSPLVTSWVVSLIFNDNIFIHTLIFLLYLGFHFPLWLNAPPLTNIFINSSYI